MTPLEFESLYESRWAELEASLRRAPRELDPERFLELYRMCCEHLSLAKARGFPAYVIERLANVTAAAHQIVYRQSGFGLARLSRALLVRFPPWFGPTATMYGPPRFYSRRRPLSSASPR